MHFPTRFRHRFAPAALTALGTLAVSALPWSCGSTAANDGGKSAAGAAGVTACGGTSDCRNGERCLSGQCRPISCANSLDCASGEVCDRTRKLCVECLADADCSNGSCVANRCVQSCRSDKDCRSLDLLCDAEAAYCVSGCKVNGDCPTGAYCAEGLCKDSEAGSPGGSGGLAGGSGGLAGGSGGLAGGSGGFTGGSGGLAGGSGGGVGGLAGAAGAGAWPSIGCGDGVHAAGEGCDDGNRAPGDGCSAACAVEPGRSCADVGCQMQGSECVVHVPTVFRDFDAGVVPDFPWLGADGVVKGMVEAKLGADGTPILASPTVRPVTSKESFETWYHDVPSNRRLYGSVVLFRDETRPRFANRFTESGQRFFSPAPVVGCTTDCVPCLYAPTLQCERVSYDGTPLFFPVDGLPVTDLRYEAKIPEQYGGSGWPPESSWKSWPKGYTPTLAHNFYFTTEARLLLRYTGAPLTIGVTGDDDVWLFVNGKLAVDLGGLHVPAAGTATIDAATAAPLFDISVGQVFEVKLFMAERLRDGSSLQLYVEGVMPSRSVCK